MLEGRISGKRANTPAHDVATPRWLTAMRRLGGHWRDIVVVLLALVVGNVALEVGYRGYQYATLPGRLFRVVSTTPSAPTDRPPAYVFDAHTGYLYTPNLEREYPHPWYSRFRTNSHGHVSRFEYPKQKPAGEYRIAV